MICLLGPSNKSDTGEESTAVQSGCSANSFLIKDGVCDDVTNVARCLFDGGDCCKKNKDTHLCLDCTCILSVDETLEKLKQNQVKVFTDDRRFNKFVSQKTVDKVQSEEVCAEVCLDEDLANVDSWSYNAKDKICTCTTFEDCYQNCQVKRIHDHRQENSTSLLTFYLKLAKSIHCGKHLFTYISSLVGFETFLTDS